ncbi:MAG: RluA family pseudouridine synthase [Acidobacteria bacterium]|nr:RluA family pseudouridine synthase [Acidobacteriota bacterium]MCY4637737.1 RluA family pseudouridine synthase [Acidobacteriota bacterium]
MATRDSGEPPPAEHIDLRVPADGAGSRLDRFLANRLGDRTRSQIQRLIREGRVELDRTAARPGTAVRAGDVVRLDMPAPAPATPRPEAIPLDVLYDDADLVVVDKPAGMVVHPAAGHADGTLVNALLHHVQDLSGIGGELRPGIVHRLDRGTSGALVVAKHDRAHAELARQFADREVEKEYAALVWGLVRQGRRIDLPIGRDPVDRKRISVRSRRAREAVTRVVTAEPLDGVTLVQVAIATGRTHQIRVHLSAVGHPVVGDSVYGGCRRHPPPHLRVVQRLHRPFLHAARLAFAHPRDGRRIEVSCALPDDLQHVADAIRAVTLRRAAGRHHPAALPPEPEEQP